MLPRLTFELPLLGLVQVETYGLAAVCAAAIGILLTRRYFARSGIEADHVLWAAVFLIPFMAIGAKVLPLAQNEVFRDGLLGAIHGPTDALAVLFALALPGGSLLSAGIFGVAGSLLYARVYRLPVGACFDAASPGLAAAIPVMRLGCLGAGCCFGTATGLPWGIRYELPQVGAATGVPLATPLHPTPLYEAALVALLAVAIATRWERLRPGQTAALMFGGYAAIRFLTEFVRGDSQLGPQPAGLTITQCVCLLLVAAALYLWKRAPQKSNTLPVNA